MSRKYFRKLVRDNIPEIIESSGRHVQAFELPKSARWTALVDKLREEVNEVTAADDDESFLAESADVYEVLMALMHERGYTDADLVNAAKQKRKKCGGFNKFIWLDSTD
jgi:predicted house-cleaning noncanonical NTP pyrophosphatase (MazG superfamily)